MVHAGSPAKARGRSLHVVQLDRKADSKYSGSPESIRMRFTDRHKRLLRLPMIS